MPTTELEFKGKYLNDGNSPSLGGNSGLSKPLTIKPNIKFDTNDYSDMYDKKLQVIDRTKDEQYTQQDIDDNINDTKLRIFAVDQELNSTNTPSQRAKYQNIRNGLQAQLNLSVTKNNRIYKFKNTNPELYKENQPEINSFGVGASSDAQLQNELVGLVSNRFNKETSGDSNRLIINDTNGSKVYTKDDVINNIKSFNTEKSKLKDSLKYAQTANQRNQINRKIDILEQRENSIVSKNNMFGDFVEQYNTLAQKNSSDIFAKLSDDSSQDRFKNYLNQLVVNEQEAVKAKIETDTLNASLENSPFGDTGTNNENIGVAEDKVKFPQNEPNTNDKETLFNLDGIVSPINKEANKENIEDDIAVKDIEKGRKTRLEIEKNKLKEMIKFGNSNNRGRGKSGGRVFSSKEEIADQEKTVKSLEKRVQDEQNTKKRLSTNSPSDLFRKSILSADNLNKLKKFYKVAKDNKDVDKIDNINQIVSYAKRVYGLKEIPPYIINMIGNGATLSEVKEPINNAIQEVEKSKTYTRQAGYIFSKTLRDSGYIGNKNQYGTTGKAEVFNFISGKTDNDIDAEDYVAIRELNKKFNLDEVVVKKHGLEDSSVKELNTLLVALYYKNNINNFDDKDTSFIFGGNIKEGIEIKGSNKTEALTQIRSNLNDILSSVKEYNSTAKGNKKINTIKDLINFKPFKDKFENFVTDLSSTKKKNF